MATMRVTMGSLKLVAVLLLGLSWTVTSCSSEDRDVECYAAFIGDQVFQNRNLKEETINIADVKRVILSVLGIPLREDVSPGESSVLRKLIQPSIGKLSDEINLIAVPKGLLNTWKLDQYAVTSWVSTDENLSEIFDLNDSGVQVSSSNCTKLTIQECLDSQNRNSGTGARVNVVFVDSINEPAGPGDFQGPSIIIELSQTSFQTAHGRKLMQDEPSSPGGNKNEVQDFKEDTLIFFALFFFIVCLVAALYALQASAEDSLKDASLFIRAKSD